MRNLTNGDEVLGLNLNEGLRKGISRRDIESEDFIEDVKSHLQSAMKEGDRRALMRK